MDDHCFHALTIGCKAQAVTITLRGNHVETIDRVKGMTIERKRDEYRDQDLMLLRISGGDRTRTFFVDHEHRNTNIREVAPELSTLPDALQWLLPAGYLARQGDTAFYATSVPAEAAEIDLVNFERLLVPLIGGRHQFRERTGSQFYTLDGRFFFRASALQRIVHPEHPPIELQPGNYELVIARGRSLPDLVEIRAANTLLVGI